MADIKPAEVSAILREQLSGFRSEAELQEVGTVLQVGDGIARIYGLTGVQYGELIEFDGGMQGIALNLEEDNVGAVLLGKSSSIKEGDTVRRLGKIASVEVGDGMSGRVVDTLYCRMSKQWRCRYCGEYNVMGCPKCIACSSAFIPNLKQLLHQSP